MVCALGFFACGGNNEPKPHFNDLNAKVSRPTMTVDTATVNSWSPQKREAIAALTVLMHKHIKLDKGRFVMGMSQEEYRKTGLPDTLYTQLIQDLETMNAYFDSEKITQGERVVIYEDFIEGLKSINP